MRLFAITAVACTVLVSAVPISQAPFEATPAGSSGSQTRAGLLEHTLSPASTGVDETLAWSSSKGYAGIPDLYAKGSAEDDHPEPRSYVFRGCYRDGLATDNTTYNHPISYPSIISASNACATLQDAQSASSDSPATFSVRYAQGGSSDQYHCFTSTAMNGDSAVACDESTFAFYQLEQNSWFDILPVV